MLTEKCKLFQKTPSMTMTEQITEIGLKVIRRVTCENFITASPIKRCPKTMAAHRSPDSVTRELIRRVKRLSHQVYVAIRMVKYIFGRRFYNRIIHSAAVIVCDLSRKRLFIHFPVRIGDCVSVDFG